MPFKPDNFERILRGSHPAFKKRERPPLSEQENELSLENKRRLQEGIGILRKLRTQALEEQDPVLRQNYLREAHQLSSRMADVIIEQVLGDRPSPIDPAFAAVLQKAREEYRDTDAGSGHAIPPQFSIGNLFKAADDLLLRVEEKGQSLSNPDHTLTEEEMRYVLQEFLRGTNDLTIDAIEQFFAKHTKIGGILSGGSVYAEMVKKIVERYSEPPLSVATFVIAVDKEKEKAVFESGDSDNSVQTVIVTDDMIDEGGTLLTALWNAGEQFPAATIYSGKGADRPGGFEKRRIQKYMGHLEMLFQDFADLSEEGKNDEALALFWQADQYARENNVVLQPGWYKRKERIEKSEDTAGDPRV